MVHFACAKCFKTPISLGASSIKFYRDIVKQWTFKPQLYQIGKSWFCVQICGKNRRLHSVILLMNDRSKSPLCNILSRFCNLKFASKIWLFKWAESVNPEISDLHRFMKAPVKNSGQYKTHCSLPSFPFCSAGLWSFVSTLNSWTQNCPKSQILRLPKKCLN